MGKMPKRLFFPLLSGYVLYLASEAIKILLLAQISRTIFAGIAKGSFNAMLIKWLFYEAIFIAAVFLSSFAMNLYKKTANRIVQRKKVAFLTQLQRSSLTKFQSKHTGEWLTLVEHDIPEMYPMLTETVVGALRPLVIGTVSVIALFVSSWQIALLATFLVLASQVVNGLFIKKNKRNNREIHDAVAASQVSFQDLVAGSMTIRLYLLGKTFVKKAFQVLSRLRTAQMADMRWRSLNNFLTSLLGSIRFFAPIIFGIYWVSIGTISLGTLMFCLTLTGNLGWFFSSLSSSLQDLTVFSSSWQRLKESDIVEEESPVESVTGAELLVEDVPSDVTLALEKFTVAYGDKVILSNVTTSVRKGQKVAVVGPSGAGKSTLLKAVMELIPHSGSLYRGDTLSSEGDKMIYIPQELQLITDTITNNLVYWADLPSSKVVDACRSVCIDDFINTLPDKYQTVIQRDSNNLSGGQRQRLVLARALLQEPAILLMDEATNALDAQTEAQIFENILKKYPDMTVLFVTHNPQNVKYADAVLRVG